MLNNAVAPLGPPCYLVVPIATPPPLCHTKPSPLKGWSCHFWLLHNATGLTNIMLVRTNLSICGAGFCSD